MLWLEHGQMIELQSKLLQKLKKQECLNRSIEEL